MKTRRRFGLTDSELLMILVLSNSQPFDACRLFMRYQHSPFQCQIDWTRDGRPALQAATQLYQFDTVTLLLQRMTDRAAVQGFQTAVRCGALPVIRQLLRLGVPLPPITSNNIWLSSCYGMWLLYSLASCKSLCENGGDARFRSRICDALCPGPPACRVRFPERILVQQDAHHSVENAATRKRVLRNHSSFHSPL
jgi:hypothetical protein